MIPPKPFIATCPQCGVVKFIAPKSDALSSLDEFAPRCEKCGVLMDKKGLFVGIFDMIKPKK